jgi:hypothetical protein
MRYRHRPGRTPNSIRYREIGDTNSVRKIAVSTNVVVVIVVVIIVGSVWISKKTDYDYVHDHDHEPCQKGHGWLI